jgi:hypothetical protein
MKLSTNIIVIVAAVALSACSRSQAPVPAAPPKQTAKVDLQKKSDEEFQARVNATEADLDAKASAAAAELRQSREAAAKAAAEAAEEGVRQRVREALRDPSSAQFRNIHPGQGGYTCGEVNAKNALGGYTGFAKFVVSDSTVWIENSPNDIAVLLYQASC